MPRAEGYEIILQGNEPDVVENYAKALNALYELGSTKSETTASMYSFGHTVSPVRTMIVNMLISMIVMLSGMLIAISIVGEKMDNTINAINVSPAPQTAFVAGKSMMGGFIAMLSIIVSLLITGYWDIKLLMIILVGLSSLILSLVVGFVQGLASDDVIEAATNVKMLFLPIAGSIADMSCSRINGSGLCTGARFTGLIRRTWRFCPKPQTGLRFYSVPVWFWSCRWLYTFCQNRR